MTFLFIEHTSSLTLSLDRFVFLSSVRVADGKLYHPDGAWDPETVYFTVYSKRELTLREREHL